MEVFGISSGNPSSIGDGSSQGKSNPIGGNSSILEVLRNSQETQNEILQVLTNSNSALIQEQKRNTDQLGLNTTAIRDLIHSLDNISADVTVSGVDSKVFNAMARLGNSESKTLGIEKFGDVYEKVVKKIAGLASYTKSIDKVTKSVTGAFGTIRDLGKGLLVFAGGLALLGFTLITFMDAITWEDMLTFASIMAVLWGASKLIGTSSWNFAKASVGIATLGLAIWAFTEVVDSKMAWDFVKSITMISVGMGILSTVSKGVGGGAMGILKGAGAIVAVAGSIWLLNKAVADFDDVDLWNVAKMGIVAGGLGVVWSILGAGMSMILQGALSAGAIGASLWVLSQGVHAINEIDMTLMRGAELASIVLATAGILTLIGNPLTIGFTLAGALATGAIGGALILLAGGMQVLSTVSVTKEQSNEFKNSIINVVDALGYLGNPLRLASMVIAVPASLAITGATIALSGAMWALSKMPQLGDTKRDEFKNTLESLVGVYSGIGSWGLVKATASSAVVALMSGATIATATAIWAFSKISAKPESVDNAVLSLDNFITGVSGAFKKNEKNFDSIGKGVFSFMGLSSMVSEIADTVSRIANMEFLEKEVINGKVVVTGVRSFTPEDFEKVGSSIGKILNALTDPLAKISSSKDSYSIGGFKVTNPFSNKVQKGIKAMAGIGGIFSPLADVVNSFYENGVDETNIKSFNKNIGLVLTGIGNAFSKGFKFDKKIVKGMREATDIVGGLFTQISDSENAEFGEGFDNFSKNMVLVKNSLKGMELDKLSKMNDLVYNMNEMEKSGAIDEFVDAFKEFLDYLMDMNAPTPAPETESGGVRNFIHNITQGEKPVAQNTLDSETMRDIISSSNGDLVEIMDRLYSFIASGNLKVQLKEDLI